MPEAPRHRRLLVLAGVLAAALLVTSCGAATPEAATVDGVRIDRSRLDDELTTLVASAEFRQGLNLGEATTTVGTDTAAIWLRTLVVQALVDREFDHRGLRLTDVDRQAARTSLEQSFVGPGVFASFPEGFQSTLVDRTARQRVLGLELARACPSGVGVSHILVSSEAEARDIVDQLRAGADFATLARQRSADTGSASAGGLLTQCLREGQFDETFTQAALAAEPGTPTDPVQTQFGWHVILTEPAPETIDATTIAEADLFGALDAWLRDQLGAATVDIDPRYGTWDASRGGHRRARGPVGARRPRVVHLADAVDAGARTERLMTRRGRVVVVGLGPAGADLLVAAARDALERIPWRFVRTARHPAVDDLAAAGIDLRAFDDRYETEPDLDAVYRAIVEALVAAAGEHGEVVYAVPGSPTVAERTVALLREAPVDLEVVPGLSFVDVAFDRLGIDPMAGARVVDGHEAAVALAGVTGPVLVAQCDSRLVLSDVKLSLIDDLGPEAAVIVLARLGRPDERVEVVALADLDRSFEPDHLTSVYVDAGQRGVATEMARFYRLVEQLRGPGGCPWDAEQTHHSLTRHLLEEAYEVVDAIEHLPAAAPAAPVPDPGAYAALADELGDLLFQVVIHTVLAGEAGAFAMRDVVEGIHDKLVRRHPHVFGTVEADTADEVVANWEQIKRGEQGRESMVDGLAAGLPALLARRSCCARPRRSGSTRRGWWRPRRRTCRRPRSTGTRRRRPWGRRSPRSWWRRGRAWVDAESRCGAGWAASRTVSGAWSAWPTPGPSSCAPPMPPPSPTSGPPPPRPHRCVDSRAGDALPTPGATRANARSVRGSARWVMDSGPASV